MSAVLLCLQQLLLEVARLLVKVSHLRLVDLELILKIFCSYYLPSQSFRRPFLFCLSFLKGFFVAFPNLF